MTAMCKVPTRESRIVDDKLNNDCLSDCCRYRKSRRKTVRPSRWSGLVHSRSFKSCQNLLVILMLWLNLSSIECFQKPQEGELELEVVWVWVPFSALTAAANWMETFNLLFSSSWTRPQLQFSIQFNSTLSFSLSPLQLLPTAFFHKLGKVHGFNQVFPRQ